MTTPDPTLHACHIDESAGMDPAVNGPEVTAAVERGAETMHSRLYWVERITFAEAKATVAEALAAALDVPQMAAAIVGHENTDTLPGDSETLVCGGCDHVLVTGDPDDDRDAQAEHATHHATLIRAAILGGAA